MPISDQLKNKLATLPTTPGVYQYKNAKGKLIYIGKAANLKNRVSSYFQASRHRDPKTEILVGEIATVDWIVVGSEAEALFLESELIKRYKPPFNIDWKDEKNFIYVKIPVTDEFPVVSYVRRPLDDRAKYFGPFTSSDSLRRAMKVLRRVFPFVTHATLPPRGCLQFHLGLCPGPEENAISARDYKHNLKKLMLYLGGHQDKLIATLEREMAQAAKKQNFELAAKTRDQLAALQALPHKRVFSDQEMFDLTLDQALVGLSDQLGLKGLPRRIEAYDISNFQGTDAVASMTVFQDGLPARDQYRKFKMRARGPNDFAMMSEVISRRFALKGEVENWPKPDLVLIDGGKGQLSAALESMRAFEVDLLTIGLAKREEDIIRSRRYDAGSDTHDFEIIRLPHSSQALQLLQRIRDEAHRFAVNYHAHIRDQRVRRSALDEIPGIGPANRKKLIKAFGSVHGVKEADEQTLATVIGPAKATIVKEHLR